MSIALEIADCLAPVVKRHSLRVDHYNSEEYELLSSDVFIRISDVYSVLIECSSHEEAKQVVYLIKE